MFCYEGELGEYKFIKAWVSKKVRRSNDFSCYFHLNKFNNKVQKVTLPLLNYCMFTPKALTLKGFHMLLPKIP